MIKKIAVSAAAAIGVVAVVILGIAASKPDEMVIERFTTIKATPAKVFALVNDLHTWTKWSPWEDKDPSMKRTFSGPAVGKGAAYSWDGNGEVGAGNMEITDATEPSNIKMNLHFLKPFEGNNTVNFSFQQEPDLTRVVWTMNGPNPFMCKVVQVFINVDDMCGKDFEKGLAKLKALAES